MPNNYMHCPYRLPAFAVFNNAGVWLCSCRGPNAYSLAVRLVRELAERHGEGFYLRQLAAR